MIELVPVALRPGAERAAVFVHGLDGSALESWGEAGAPGAFPRRCAEALPGLDVLALGYPARLSAFLSGLNLERIADGAAPILGEKLRRRYRRIGVVAHCFGGVVAASALRRTAGRGPEAAFAFLDAPQLCPAAPSAWLARLMSRLAVTAEALERNHAFLTSAAGPPHLAIVGAGPGWVDACAPLAVAAPGAQRRLALPHADLPRAPAAGRFEPLEIVVAWLAEAAFQRD